MFKNILKIAALTLTAFGITLIMTILSLRWINPPFTAFTLQTDWNRFDQESYNLRNHWVPVGQIPEHMIWAAVAAEDQLFFEHYGFDFESIENAWGEHRESVRTRGASTISQQVAKNLFLSPVQSFIRKGVEAGITIFIELLWPKERIIEIYLNIAEFGPGIFGIGKASDVYFNRPAHRLSPEMAARLAAVLPNPKRMQVNPPSPYTQKRSLWILRQMNQLTGKNFPLMQADSTADKSEDFQSDTASVNSIQIKNQPDSFSVLLPNTDILNESDTLHQN